MIWFFDLDNTLVDRAAAFHGWASDLVTAQGGSDADLAALLVADAGGHAPKPDVAHAVRDRLGVTDSVEDVVRAMRQGIRDRIAAYPGVLEVLEGLRADGDLVAIVTNGAGFQQRGKLAATGLTDRADAVVVSGEAGVEKPDPRIFDLAFEALGLGSDLDRGAAWMVGDAAHADVAGARRAGLRAVWVAHGRTWSTGTAPDVVVERTVDAPAAVRSLLGA